MPQTIAVPASRRDLDGVDQVRVGAPTRLIAERVAELAAEVDRLWRAELPQGDLAFRLVEASHALHRAAFALDEPVPIG